MVAKCPQQNEVVRSMEGSKLHETDTHDFPLFFLSKAQMKASHVSELNESLAYPFVSINKG